MEDTDIGPALYELRRFCARLLVIVAMWLAVAPAASAHGSRPDPAVTPGALNPAVTQLTLSTTICVGGWAHTVRPPARYTSRLKRRQLRALAWPDQRMRDYEEDHLVPLELGGAPADRRNLWPEPRYPSDGWTAQDKDRLENVLHGMVCGGTLGLDAAWRAVTADWTAAYRLYVRTG